MKSLAFVLAVIAVKCVTSYPAPEKVGVIIEGPDSVIIKGPDGSVIKSKIGWGVVPPLVVPVVVPVPKPSTEVEIIEPKTETNENEGDDSSTEELTETVEVVTPDNSGGVARVLQAEEELKEVQRQEIEAQQAANQEAIAQIEEQQRSQQNNQ